MQESEALSLAKELDVKRENLDFVIEENANIIKDKDFTFSLELENFAKLNYTAHLWTSPELVCIERNKI